MQTEFSGRADVHGGTFAHSFHAAEGFDGVGGVVSVGGFAVLGLRVVCRVVFRVEEFGLQFFRGHSAPWKMPGFPTPAGPTQGPLKGPDRTPGWRDDSGTARVRSTY